MERIIKFRTWVSDDNKMVYPLGFSTGMQGNEFRPLIKCSDGNRAYKDYPTMQFTGYKDKEGKEIYEGDIVSVIGTKSIGEYLTEVYWDKHGFTLKVNKSRLTDSSCLLAVRYVLGNKFENPELLNSCYDGKT